MHPEILAVSASWFPSYFLPACKVQAKSAQSFVNVGPVGNAYLSVLLHSPLCSIHVRITCDYMALRQHFATALFESTATAIVASVLMNTSTYAGTAPNGALHSASLGSLAGTFSANQPCHRLRSDQRFYHVGKQATRF